MSETTSDRGQVLVEERLPLVLGRGGPVGVADGAEEVLDQVVGRERLGHDHDDVDGEQLDLRQASAGASAAAARFGRATTKSRKMGVMNSGRQEPSMMPQRTSASTTQ